jgi:phenylalanyl-tRNA synthetase beta chain
LVVSTLVGAVVHNLNRGANGVRLFEVGHAFRPGSAGGVEEGRRLALAATGPTRPVDWSRPVPPIDFFDVKGTIEGLLSLAGLDAVAFVPAERGFLHPGRQARLEDGGKEVGFLGEIHPRVAEGWGIEERLVVAELDLDALTRQPPPLRLRPVPREPAVERDLALVVPATHAGERVERAVREAGVEDLVAVEVFDRYRGPQVPDGHVSLGLRLTFQAERTLTVQAIDDRIEALVQGLATEHGYRLR